MAKGLDKPRRDGRCYENSGKFIVELYRMGGAKGWELVHGRPTLTRPPFEKFGHAWVEYATDSGARVVVDPAKMHEGKIMHVPARQYYACGKVDPSECYRYTPEEAVRLMNVHESYGPWEGVEAEGLKPAAKL